MTKFYKFLLSFSFFCFIGFFSSCSSDFYVNSNQNGADFTFNLSLENSSLISIFNQMNGIVDESENSSLDSSNSTFNFDEKGIEKTLTQLGIKNVNVKNQKENFLVIKGSIEKNTDNFVLRSGILKFDDKNNVKLEISSQTLISLYENLSNDLLAYLDMLGAPCFTGEKMANQEYLDFVATIYGQEFADELKLANMNFVIQNEFNKKSEKISLLKILNITEKIEI